MLSQLQWFEFEVDYFIHDSSFINYQVHKEIFLFFLIYWIQLKNIKEKNNQIYVFSIKNLQMHILFFKFKGLMGNILVLILLMLWQNPVAMGTLKNGIKCKFVALLWQFLRMSVSFQNLVLIQHCKISAQLAYRK